MYGDREAFVVEAELELEDATDPGAVGAAVTAELCGDWTHEGPCRWPHNNAIVFGSFRTVVVAEPEESELVLNRVEAALRDGAGWTFLRARRRGVADQERALAERLARTSRASL